MHKCKFIVLALFLVAAPATGRAQEADAAQRAFVGRYVAALTAQDRDALVSLHHPASRACMGADNRDFYDYVFAQDLRHGADLRGGYKLTRFVAADAVAVAASEMGGLVPNPVPPSHLFQIDTPFDANNHSLMILHMAAEHDGAWFIVTGCPTAQAVAFFRQRRAEGERQQARARQLAGEVREPLLSEIKELLAQHRRIDAVRRYKDGADVDLTTASQVIDALASR